LVTTLPNGATVANPPPCNTTNIEAVVTCGPGAKIASMIIELYTSNNTLVQSIVEKQAPYFLFGNGKNNIYNGRIPPGAYKIRSKMNGVTAPFTKFTLGGKCL
jgi:hypothetical protein